MEHIIFVIGEPIPQIPHPRSVRFVGCQSPPDHRLSIGYYHNLGAQLAESEWIMKLDVDAFPNRAYFSELLGILDKAGPKEWFNGGMFYVNQASSARFLSSPGPELLSVANYLRITRSIDIHCSLTYKAPAATNFICRRENYLKLGGCDQRFLGYGWEDYQQIYMLERYQRGQDPLPGTIDMANVSERCRDEISRPKARELIRRNEMLGLLHHWHPGSKDPTYKSPKILQHNRQVLLDYVLRARLITNCEGV